MKDEIQEVRDNLIEARKRLRQLESQTHGGLEEKMDSAGGKVQIAIQDLNRALSSLQSPDSSGPS